MADIPPAVAEGAIPAGLASLVARLAAADLLADGDHSLIAEMHELDPDGTAWLLRDMLLRARASQ